MNSLKIALIEDDEDLIETFKRTSLVLEEIESVNIDIIECKNFNEFKNKFLEVSQCDGLVVDMKLTTENGEEESGVEILREFSLNKLIIPTVIFTGTKDIALSDFPFLEIRLKGDTDIKDIIRNFLNIKKSGILDILGGKGILQDYLYNVFHKNIDKQKDSWFEHAADDPDATKKALLRHTVNHLNQYIDEEDDKYYLQEMYIYPPIAQKIKPGSILRKNTDSNKNYIILTPACDLAQEKAHCILLCEIITPKQLISTRVRGEGNSSSRKGNLRPFITNTNPNFHFLPPIFAFEGGFIDFASVLSVSPQECVCEYSETVIQISSAFIADIVSRFSIYYSRQGQPDLKHLPSYFEDILSETPYTGISTSLARTQF